MADAPNSPLRRFLYLTPYFPPMTRVGALRPLKFARHLPSFGWAPVVLADLREGDGVDRALLDEVPKSTTVIWDYGRHARANMAAFERGERPSQGQAKRATGARKPLPARVFERVSELLDSKNTDAKWLPSPEWLPLGVHVLDVPHALAAARRVLAEQRCEAIMVNADPYAAMLVGLELARETKLPLIQDLRDPWSVCSLRRPQRPWLQRRWVDLLERKAVEGASKVILNTARSRADYVAHYGDLPAERFAVIRNHGDAGLLDHGGPRAGFDRFTALVMGNFRRFIDGDVLVAALAELRRRGYGPERLQVIVAGDIPPNSRELIEQHGVADMIHKHPHVSYLEIGPFMASADLLIALNNDTQQRFPAKVFDYATSERPILVVANNPELSELMAKLGGARVCGLDDVQGVADVIAAEIEAGRQRAVERRPAGMDSYSAAGELAAILDEVTR